MQKTKLVTLLKALNQKELNRLDDFLISPFFNKDERLVRLYRHLKKHYPKFSIPKLEKEVVFNEVFPREKLTTKQQNHLTYRLCQLVEEFLTQLKLEEKKAVKSMITWEAYDREGLHKYFFSCGHKIQKELLSSPQIDFMHYFHVFYLNFMMMFQIEDKNEAEFQTYFKNFNRYLDWAYFGIKLKSIEVAGVLNGEFSFDDKVSYEEKILKQVAKLDGQLPDLLKAFHEVALHHNNTKTLEGYFALKDSLFEKMDQCGSERQHLLAVLMNYITALRYKNRGNGMLKEKLQLFEYGFEKGIFRIDKDLDFVNFLNLIKLACKLREFEKAEHYKNEFFKSNRGEKCKGQRNYVRICFAFYRNNFQQALDLMLKNDTYILDHRFKLDLRFLKAMTRYKLDDSEKLWLELDAFERSIRRQKSITNPLKNAALNFVKALRKLDSIDKSDKTNLALLRDKIWTKEVLIFRNWLLDEVDQKLGQSDRRIEPQKVVKLQKM